MSDRDPIGCARLRRSPLLQVYLDEELPVADTLDVRLHLAALSWPRVWPAWALSLLIILTPGGAGGEHIHPAVGHRAPDFTLHGLQAKTVRLFDVLGKKAVFVNFWATWCVPCREEMPTMERAYRAYKARGLEMLAVSVDVGPEAAVALAVGKFMAELKLSFPALLDPEWKVVKLYRVVGLPATFLIDRRGVIRAVEVGQRDWFSPESRKRLEDLLK